MIGPVEVRASLGYFGNNSYPISLLALSFFLVRLGRSQREASRKLLVNYRDEDRSYLVITTNILTLARGSSVNDGEFNAHFFCKNFFGSGWFCCFINVIFSPN